MRFFGFWAQINVQLEGSYVVAQPPIMCVGGGMQEGEVPLRENCLVLCYLFFNSFTSLRRHVTSITILIHSRFHVKGAAECG